MFTPLPHRDAFCHVFENIMEMEHLLFGSKCSIFHNNLKIQNLAYFFPEYFQSCLKIENDVMI